MKIEFTEQQLKEAFEILLKNYKGAPVLYLCHFITDLVMEGVINPEQGIKMTGEIQRDAHKMHRSAYIDGGSRNINVLLSDRRAYRIEYLEAKINGTFNYQTFKK